eukprot:jgi/Mesvir1/19297/Mv10370-RA.1
MPLFGGSKDKNPYTDDEPNPFADPSVTMHTNALAATTPEAGSFDSYSGGNQQVAPVIPDVQMTAISQQSAAEKAKLAKMEKELRDKEAALKKKEEELKKREKAVVKGGKGGDEKNWPVCWPLIHHDIANDIPAHLHGAIKRAYFSLILVFWCFAWNMLCVTIGMFTGHLGDKAAGSWFLAVIYTITGVPGAYLLWYKRLYNGMRHDKALLYGGFFMCYLIHIAFCIYAAVAPPIFGDGKSMTGFLTMVDMLSEAVFLGVLYVIGFASWAIEALLSFWTIQFVYRKFRSSGGGDRLRTEGMSAAMRAGASAV